MMNRVTPTQVHAIAKLAAAARAARDRLLRGVADEIVGEPHPTKGEQDRTGSGAFDVLPAGSPAVRALQRAIGDLDVQARSELFALMRIGQGELAPGDWERGLSEAATLGEANTFGVLADDIDLQSHLEKGLYQIRSH
jgi:hypothetical protein